jgi:hypothetical protein
VPFVSDSQRKWMYANKPAMAKKWEAHTPKGKKLPEHVAKPEHEKTSSIISECFSKISKTLVKVH